MMVGVAFGIVCGMSLPIMFLFYACAIVLMGMVGYYAHDLVKVCVWVWHKVGVVLSIWYKRFIYMDSMSMTVVFMLALCVLVWCALAVFIAYA